MADVLSSFIRLLPVARRTARGWTNFNCVFCGDTRGRGGFLETPTGGFRYRCFNGGCEANEHPTGWEPGGGLGGRPRKLFTLLGGDLSDLPVRDLVRSSDRFSRTGTRLSAGGESATVSFDDVELPQGAVPLEEVPDGAGGPGLVAVADYLLGLGSEVCTRHRYHWTPIHPWHLIVPYYHHGRIVGWAGRNCAPTGGRFIGRCGSDYIFRQDTIERGSSRSAIVVEGVMNAIAINGLAVRNSTPTRKQELLLNVCGQDVIVLPDQDRDTGMSFITAAERNGWRVSVPRWDSGVKDVIDAVRRYGMLHTIESVVAGATKNYVKARAALNMGGRAGRG